MNTVIKIKSIEESARKIFDLDQKIFTVPLSFPSKNIKEIIDAYKNCVIQLAYDGDNVVGFSAHEKRKDGTVLIKSVGILQSYQHKGIGSELMKNIIEKSKGMSLQLHTHPENKQAIQFYWKLGFSIVGWKENYFGPGKHRLLMQKQN